MGVGSGLAIKVFNITLKSEHSAFTVARFFGSNLESVDHALNIQDFGFNVFLLQHR